MIKLKDLITETVSDRVLRLSKDGDKKYTKAQHDIRGGI